MTAIVQLPANQPLSGTTGHPFALTLNVTVTGSGAWTDLSAFTGTVYLNGVAQAAYAPTVTTPSTGVVSVVWSAAQTLAMGALFTMFGFEVDCNLFGSGPYGLVAGAFTINPPGTSGTSSSSSALSVTVGATTLALAVSLGGVGGGGTTGALLVANNLSDVANVVTARTNLGLGTAATTAASAYDAAGAAATAQAAAIVASAQRASNLSDLASATTARTNLVVAPYGRTTFSDANYTVLTTDVAIFQTGTLTAARTVTLPAASSVPAGWEIFIGDESGSVTASNTIILARSSTDTLDGLTSVSITSPYGARRVFSNGVGKWTFDGGVLRIGNNLSDVANVVTARTNLGLGTAAVAASTAFDAAGAATAAQAAAIAASNQRASNLSDVANVVTARTNLGLGTAATTAASAYDAAGAATAAQVAAIAASAALAGPFAPSTTGANSAGRYVGVTLAGAPTTGTFILGDWVTDQTGKRWTCTTAGTPGTWAQEPGTTGSTKSYVTRQLARTNFR